MENQKLNMLCEIIRFQRSIIPFIYEAVQTAYLAKDRKASVKERKVNMAFDRFNKKVIETLKDELNVDFIEFASGSQYEEGLPVEAMNIEDFEGVDNLIIANMLEPAIKEKGTSNILKNGKVILAEAKR